jgi:hypothetical protein
MYKHLFAICIAAVAMLAVAACNRKDEETDVAGKGGNAVLKVVPKHHDDEIDSCKVYIKYNTLDVASSYDDSASVIQVNGAPVATFSGLKKGKYYLYGKGWDASISKEVKGGLPQTIAEDKTYELTLPVSEVH